MFSQCSAPEPSEAAVPPAPSAVADSAPVQEQDGGIAPAAAAAAPTTAAGPLRVQRGRQAVRVLGAGVVLVSSLVGGLLGGLGRRRRRAAQQRQLKAGAAPAVAKTVSGPVLDLTPFGSPAVGTPTRLTVGATSKEVPESAAQSAVTSTSGTPSKSAARDTRSSSGDVAPSKDQKQLLADYADLSRQLALVQSMQEEQRRAREFLEQYKAQTESLLKLAEKERTEQQQVIKGLQEELQDLKARPAFPLNGRDLEAFKRQVNGRAYEVAQSTYSESEKAGMDTMSADNKAWASSKLTASFKAMFGGAQRPPAGATSAKGLVTPGSSQPSTPRGVRAAQPQQRIQVDPSKLDAVFQGRMMF